MSFFRLVFPLSAFRGLCRFGAVALLLAVAMRGQEVAKPGAPGRRFSNLSERGTIVAGSTEDNFPYGYRGTDGRTQGFAVDMLDAVARVMNLHIRREVAPGKALLERFQGGEFDMLQVFSQSPEREGYVDFSVPFLTLQGCIFVRKTDSPIHKLDDFSGRDFAIIGAGSMGEQFLAEHRVYPRLVRVSSSEEGLALVDRGECAGVFVSRLTAFSVLERVGLRNVALFGQPLADYDIRHCFGVHKGDAQLLARLNEGLAILHRTGEFDEIYRRWFGRFDTPLFTREQVITYVALALALAFGAAMWGWLRQRALGRRIAGQAAQLAEKEALLQALYDNIPMAMCVLENLPGGPRVLAINRQAEPHFGVGSRQAVGRRLTDFSLDREWGAHLRELLHQWSDASTHVREERRLETARKHFVFTLVRLAPGASGDARLCILAEDVSERRQLDEEIAQTRKLRAVGELVGGIAHEFNNLLTPVMLKAGEIQLGWEEDAKLQQEVLVITQAVQRAAELTRRLLTFGRKGDHRAAAVRLETVVNGCFALLRQTVDRRIDWESTVPADLPPLWFNATDLNQILLNLLINARDTLLEKLARQPGDWRPCIRVEVVALAASAVDVAAGTGRAPVLGWQQLTVRDNGLGMTRAVRERIFEPFYTTKEVGKGTGLGLATVWHLLTESGGRIEVESDAGVGSTFRVLLPVWPVPEAPPVAVPVAPAVPAGAARVFVAEDDELVASALMATLRRAGHQVKHFNNGAHAWEHLERAAGEYDLMVFDVNMPGLDGIELAHRLRTAKFTGRIMIVSGRLTLPELQSIDRARVDRVLAKPFSMEEFLSAVNGCLQRAR